jgi:AraC-like DNA-binding protein
MLSKRDSHLSETPRIRNAYRIPRALLVAFEEAGVDLPLLCRRRGIAVESLHDCIPAAQADTLLALAFAEVGDPAFGLTVGAKVRPELFGAVGFAAMSCDTYGEALARIARYKRVMGGDHVEIVSCGRLSIVRSYRDADIRSFARQVLDGELAFMVALGRFLTGQPLRPERVAIAFPRPDYHARCVAFFQCPVVFDTPYSELVFQSDDLKLPLVSRNPALAPFFEEKAEELRGLPEGELPFAERVRSALRYRLRGDLPTIELVAKDLAMSERSLQRKLAQEGVSFQSLVDKARSELAQRYLRHQKLDAAEVSYLLGFSHPNSFYRAFKRWMQMTPEEYRRLPA